MSKAINGSIVKVHYTGNLDDGTLFDSTDGGDPLQFTLGKGQVIQGFEEAIIGMGIGESKTVTISSEKAYGPHRKDLIFKVDKAKLPNNIDPEVGQKISAKHNDNKSVINFVVTEVDKENVTLDANHPLAGKDLTFKIDLIEVESLLN